MIGSWEELLPLITDIITLHCIRMNYNLVRQESVRTAFVKHDGASGSPKGVEEFLPNQNLMEFCRIPMSHALIEQ